MSMVMPMVMTVVVVVVGSMVVAETSMAHRRYMARMMKMVRTSQLHPGEERPSDSISPDI